MSGLFEDFNISESSSGATIEKMRIDMVRVTGHNWKLKQEQPLQKNSIIELKQEMLVMAVQTKYIDVVRICGNDNFKKIVKKYSIT